MTIRVTLVILTALMSDAGASAQPDKGQPQAKVPATAAAPVILASASDVRRQTPASAGNSSEPGRRPAPRVTTCRCGDSQAAEDQPEQPDQ